MWRSFQHDSHTAQYYLCIAHMVSNYLSNEIQIVVISSLSFSLFGIGAPNFHSPISSVFTAVTTKSLDLTATLMPAYQAAGHAAKYVPGYIIVGAINT